MKKILTLALSLLLALTALVGCNAPEADVPEGMKNAALDGVEYALFVPENWVINKNSGVSGAYVSAYDKSNVSVNSYLPSTAMTIEDYWAFCAASYEKEFDSFAQVENGVTTMAGVNAPYYVYTATIGGVEYKFLQAITATGDMFYTLTYTATPDTYDTHLESVMKIIEEFTLR